MVLLIVVILCGGMYFRDLFVSVFLGVVLRLRGVSVDGIVLGGVWLVCCVLYCRLWSYYERFDDVLGFEEVG